MKNILPFISLLLLLVNSVFPYVVVSNVFAEESTPSATELISPDPAVSPTPATQPATTPAVTPTPSVEPTPIITVEPVQEVTPSAAPAGNVVLNEDYKAPQNNKVKVRFNKLPETSGTLTIKEVKLSAEQIQQTGALTDTAYEITSSMTDGTFVYDLTLPLPPQAQNQEIRVKAAETEAELPQASELSEPKEKTTEDTITIKGLNHFTVFIVTAPSPDTIQRVLINEIAPTAAIEWVELYNNGTASVNLAAGTGWVIRNSAGNSESLSALGTIAPAGRAVFNTPATWLLDVAPETVTILNELGSTIDTVTVSLTAPGFAIDHYPLVGESVGRKTDGITEWAIFTTPSKGTANAVLIAPGGGLVETSSVNSNTGFPSWYKDSNGLALDLLEATDGFSISDPVDPANPFSQQIGFNAEGFWWSAEASIDNGTQTGLLVLALEAVFAGEAAVDGEQSVQNRLRYRIDGLVPGGTYTIHHPFGDVAEVADAVGVINVTDDIGCFAGGGVTCDQTTTPNFSTPLSGQIGPYLTWTTFNTNPALTDPQLTNPANPGRRYVGNPNIDHAVAGSPTGQNSFSVTGPGLSNFSTNLFSVSGRLADANAPVITLFGANPVNAVQNSTYTDAGATAIDDLGGNLTGSIIVTGLPVDTTTLGAKTVTYTVTDGAGRTTVATRTVNVVAAGGVDTTMPVITILGTSPVSVVAGTPYIDAGATALDNVDGDITANIVTVSNVNTAVIGTYTVAYNVSDATPNAAIEVVRTVNVVADPVAPVITITGSNPVNILTGAAYTDTGATATDNVDGSLTALIVTTGLPITTVVPGTFTVTYVVTDAAGNSATATRTVNVVNTLTGSLAAVSTINPANGYPTWYKDSAGLALQLCLAGANGLADGNCTLPGAGEEPTFNPAQAVSFPANFPGEAFWYLADSDVASAGQTGAGRVRLRYALESAFTTETPTADQQIAFLRVNMQRIEDLIPGATYTVTHPFGQFTVHAGDALLENGVTPNPDAGVADDGRFFRLEDGAFAAPLTDVTAASFLSAATTHISKFLKQTNPLPPAGYIGDGATLSTIESGPNGNFVRIEGPNIDVGNYDGDGNPNVLTINLWTVSGKLADITAPVITVTGTNPVDVAQNAAYTDAGATATDDFDGNVTASIVTTGVPVDTAIVGSKTITYTATDRAGNTATATRIVNVTGVDTTAPVITRLGTSPVSVTVGSAYTDAGATALDNVDGNLTAGIVTINPVNSNIIGSYTVTYNVSDAAGNAATPATRTVNVVAPATATISGLVFHDINANKIKDAGEPVLPGWTLFLDTNLNKAPDGGEVSTVSDASGNYQFPALTPGTYNVNEVVQPDWGIRLPGGNGYTQTVATGENITGKDFGNIITRVITGQGLGGFATTTGTALTPSVVSVGDSIINVSSNGGTSKVIIPADTIINTSTGVIFDAAALAASDPTGSIISGLGSGVAVKGKLQWGVPNLGLLFSTPITLEIFVGADLNGQTLNVLRSVDGTTGWTNDGIVAPGKCTVAAGICTFQATKASYYVASQKSEDTTTNNNPSDDKGGNSTQAPVCNDAYTGGAPVLLSAEATGLNQVTLTWSKALDPVTHYVVSYGLEAGKPLYGNPNAGGKDTTFYTVKNLSGGTTYFFSVRAGNGCNGGEYSNELSATPFGEIISGPAKDFEQGVLGIATTSPSVLGSPDSPKQVLNTKKLPIAILLLVLLTIAFNLIYRKIQNRY